MTDSKPHSLLITRVREQARNIRSFDMRPDVNLITFIPGQVAALRVEACDQTSYFAFASAPEDPELEFLIKRNGGGGAGPLIYEMEPGNRVELAAIAGHGFALDEHRGKDLVFVAMGTGVAPLRSALRHALGRAGDFGQIVVLYGARTPDDFCYRDETESWRAAGVELRQVISSPAGYEWAGPVGYVQSLLDNVLPTLADPVALVCGSREMIEQTRERLREMGFAPEAILTNH